MVVFSDSFDHECSWKNANPWVSVFLPPSLPPAPSTYFSIVALPRAVICTIWQSWRQSSWGKTSWEAQKSLWGFLFSLSSHATEKHKARKPKRVFGFMPIVWLEFLQHQNNKPSINTKQYSSAALLPLELLVLSIESSHRSPGSSPVFVNFLT